MQIRILLINEHGIEKALHVDFSPEDTLLDHIESAGARSPYGCRVGSCGTCVAKIGNGRNLLKPRDALEKECCSRVAPDSEEARLPCRAKFDLNNIAENASITVRKIKII